MKKLSIHQNDKSCFRNGKKKRTITHFNQIRCHFACLKHPRTLIYLSNQFHIGTYLMKFSYHDLQMFLTKIACLSHFANFVKYAKSAFYIQHTVHSLVITFCAMQSMWFFFVFFFSTLKYVYSKLLADIPFLAADMSFTYLVHIISKCF